MFWREQKMANAGLAARLAEFTRNNSQPNSLYRMDASRLANMDEIVGWNSYFSFVLGFLHWICSTFDGGITHRVILAEKNSDYHLCLCQACFHVTETKSVDSLGNWLLLLVTFRLCFFFSSRPLEGHGTRACLCMCVRVCVCPCVCSLEWIAHFGNPLSSSSTAYRTRKTHDE